MDDAAFSTTGGLLTHRELRLLCLAELALQPHEILWDIGAGSGAVAIEAARAQPTATVYAIERRSVMLEHIRINQQRFPAPNLHPVAGTAPAACAALPDPHAVFVGGSSGQLEAILGHTQQRLYRGGRLVVTLVTLENLQTARACLPEARVVQVQMSVGQPIVGMLRFAALNPVFLVTWRKPLDEREQCS
jgi:precorrin-6Y C5,15-methyltransferase (decarboxylating)